jgi:hypothetical protein
MVTAGALEHQEPMLEGKNLSLQRCSSLKGLSSRRKQRENDREHAAAKLSDGCLNSTISPRARIMAPKSLSNFAMAFLKGSVSYAV